MLKKSTTLLGAVSLAIFLVTTSLGQSETGYFRVDPIERDWRASYQAVAQELHTHGVLAEEEIDRWTRSNTVRHPHRIEDAIILPISTASGADPSVSELSVSLRLASTLLRDKVSGEVIGSLGKLLPDAISRDGDERPTDSPILHCHIFQLELPDTGSSNGSAALTRKDLAPVQRKVLLEKFTSIDLHLAPPSGEPVLTEVESVTLTDQFRVAESLLGSATIGISVEGIATPSPRLLIVARSEGNRVTVASSQASNLVRNPTWAESVDRVLESIMTSRFRRNIRFDLNAMEQFDPVELSHQITWEECNGLAEILLSSVGPEEEAMSLEAWFLANPEHLWVGLRWVILEFLLGNPAPETMDPRLEFFSQALRNPQGDALAQLEQLPAEESLSLLQRQWVSSILTQLRETDSIIVIPVMGRFRG